MIDANLITTAECARAALRALAKQTPTPGELEQARLEFTAENDGARRTFPFLTLQGFLQPSLNEALLEMFQRSGRHPKGLGHDRHRRRARP